uniref:Cytochrome c oxidase subunit 2 n=1 Tax=Aplidium conicum TaxID=286149 RepID=D1GKY8_APLCO|nr:cytochrome c oxidase subunit II [Aplidium conicum]CAX68842.1 cytochrome c oxidase subunit 2 [Aplidium conicum]
MFFSRFGLMDGSNMVANCMLLFHDYCLVLMATILTYVIFMFFICYKSRGFSVTTLQGSNFLEMVWTIIPMFFLLSLGLPSFMMMYYLEGESKGDLTYKVIGHQWYWSYENNDFIDYSFDSYMLPLEEMNVGDNRLLEVDNGLTLPYGSLNRMVITSTDVLHAWALPSMCLKVDAVPGRLNTLSLFSLSPGTFYGQCSEICGINHSFMPIKVEFIGWNDFLKSLFN